MTEEQKQEKRENIMRFAMTIDQSNIAELEHLDVMICDAMDFDPDEDVPMFIADALLCMT